MTICLTDSEWKIMNLLWARGELTIQELTGLLSADTGWSKQTVISFLNRLESKHAVAFTRQGGARRYFAQIERTKAALDETRSLVDKVFSGSLSLMMNTIVKHQALSDDERAELEEIVRRMESTDQKEDLHD